MIKIHDKIWYVKKPNHEDGLAYMAPYEETKDGSPTSSVAKMQSTGRSWATVREQTVYKKKEGATWEYVYDENNRPIIDRIEPAKEGEEAIVENLPTTGFYVGCSVSRWSTSNKLFRVQDPRGFTVEIPTDNLATLLHHTTVVKGVVQDLCVWGREGNSHILLPVNSEPYLLTLDQMDTLENKLVSKTELKPGDWVKMFNDEKEYYYAGKVKGTWNVIGETRNHSYQHGSPRKSVYSQPVEVEDDKWSDLFLHKYTYGNTNKWHVETPSKPKIVEVVKNEQMFLTLDQYSWYCPERVKNKSGLNDHSWHYVKGELVAVEFKG